MFKKYIVTSVLIINMVLILTGCYIAFKDYYHEEDYREIWELTGFRHGYEGVSPFFPERIDNLEVKDFLCRYDQQIPLGEGVQLFMKIQYIDKMIFDKEYDKIRSMAFDCNDFFEVDDLSAYAVRLGEEWSTEYALIDEEQQIIYYIFLYSVPKSQIRFNHRLLPAGYEDYWDNYTKKIYDTE